LFQNINKIAFNRPIRYGPSTGQQKIFFNFVNVPAQPMT
jgi:hypothetical protein